MNIDLIRRALHMLEWSGYRLGQGSGYMGSGSDGNRYPACPMCGQLAAKNVEFKQEAVGHNPDCLLNLALKEVSRPPSP